MRPVGYLSLGLMVGLRGDGEDVSVCLTAEGVSYPAGSHMLLSPSWVSSVVCVCSCSPTEVCVCVCVPITPTLHDTLCLQVDF